MQKGTKLTVRSSTLEFRVSGADRDLRHWEAVPFLRTTKDWEEALAWLQKLEGIVGDPHLTVIEVIEVEETEAPLRMVCLDTDWAKLDAEKAERKLESLAETEEALRQASNQQPQQRKEAQKALEEARTEQGVLHNLLKEHSIMQD